MLLLWRCRCSGDDGVNCCGSARPILHDCTIQVHHRLQCVGVDTAPVKTAAVDRSTAACHSKVTAERGPLNLLQGRKAGVRCFDDARPMLQSCQIEDCGGVGVIAMQNSHTTLQG